VSRSPTVREAVADPAAPTGMDRAAMVRSALRCLVAENGLHATPMSAVAARAGVATGTAYVHYASKDELVLAAFREAKVELGTAAVARMDPDAPPATRFEQLWLGVHGHLTQNPELARFLTQVENSPYTRLHHVSSTGAGDPLTDAAQAPDMAMELLPLPLEVLFDLGLAPAIRLVSSGVELGPDDLRSVAHACWRAITRP
jgi:AcrR family transcriptional regulator